MIFSKYAKAYVLELVSVGWITAKISESTTFLMLLM